MTRHSSLLRIALVLLGTSLLPTVEALTPVTKAPPKLAIRWLGTLTVSPAIAAPGTRFVGTVKLLRPTDGDLRVNLGLNDSTAIAGVGFELDGVVVPQSVTVPAGKDQATFIIDTADTYTKMNAMSKTFTARAYQGPHSLAASFTIDIRRTSRP